MERAVDVSLGEGDRHRLFDGEVETAEPEAADRAHRLAAPCPGLGALRQGVRGGAGVEVEARLRRARGGLSPAGQPERRGGHGDGGHDGPPPPAGDSAGRGDGAREAG
ncbi:hypothetical protein [Streptomyces sp. RFCAC02]|uniref:hypothetical protein n=1 Tax=Streptomyces sp. RFCAC02 TaxID=2499143 RepID=UPI001F10A530|nr:hypothetical protein [Streptomyces sp. RFCAC02]